MRAQGVLQEKLVPPRAGVARRKRVAVVRNIPFYLLFKMGDVRLAKKVRGASKKNIKKMN